MAKGIVTQAMHAKAWNAARRQQISNIRAAEDAHKEERDKAQRKSTAKRTKAKKAKAKQPTGAPAKSSGALAVPAGHTTRIIEGANVREVQFAKAGKKQKPTGHTTRIIEGPNVREVQFEKVRRGRKGTLDGLSHLVSRLQPKR